MASIKKNNTASTSQQLVVNSLVIKTLNRQSQDIDTWRTALKSADINRRTRLYDLYEDILLDNVLSDAIEKRIEAITNADLIFSVNDSEVDEINKLMETQEWENMLREILLAKFWGVTLLEFDYTNKFTAYSIPRNHVRPDKGVITRQENDDNGTNYRNDPFFLEIQTDRRNGRDSFGLILKACPYVIYKRGNFGDWAQFAELFGMPFRIGKYNSYDEQTRMMLQQALEKSGSAAWVVIPKDGDIEYCDNKTTADGQLYDKLRKACNEEILYGILGQSMTTAQGEKGARSLGEVHLQVQESKHASDRRFIARILNNDILPRLEARGWPVKGGKFAFPEIGETLGLNDRVEVDMKLNEIIEIDADYFYGTYGIPKPKNGGGKKKKPESQEQPINKPADIKKQENKLSSPSKLPKWERVLSFFVKAPSTGGAKISGSLHTGSSINLADLSSFNSESLLKRVADGESETFDTELFLWTAENLIHAFRIGWNHTSGTLSDFDYSTGFDAAKEVMEMNLFQFSAAKNIAETYTLNQLFRSAESYTAFKDAASTELKKWNENWLKTEYDTALLVAEQSETYYRLQEKKKIFPFWMYKTQDDNLVRYTHRQLHNIILSTDSHLWDSIYPPNDWRCRCYVVPRMKHEVSDEQIAKGKKKAGDYLQTATYKRSEKTGWGRNRAKLKQVFTANQMYLKNYSRGAKAINKLDYTHWGLDSAKKLKENASDNIAKYTGSATDWWNNQIKIENNVVLTDYNGRRLKLTPDVFTNNTSKKKQYRMQYLDAMQETLHNPDEIYGTGSESMDTKTLIKYFKDEIMVVICSVKQGQVGSNGVFEVKTWFPMTMKKRPIQKIRAGVLIKKHPQ